MLQANGVVQGISLQNKNQSQVEYVQQLVNQLAGQGAVLLPDAGLQETAYWNPAIVTDENGQATITFTISERSTAWTLAAKGLTMDTLAGEYTSDLTAKKELFGELKLPLAFRDGDRGRDPGDDSQLGG